ncbi:histidine phosphatase family protein [Streptomyces sp. WMMB 322]|uniref:histidine phosphatase family protein n=1 Tax=Streptomyces sp. WMMB 322 TaxID=1286821 RepID=UPI0006E386D7|nr:histidine phosphatase family protein [Streptomyces sp. WMMB 322]SCK25461.1 Broad specificity phosphatase PhoE [Streptomyces sp. WMMB 322]
MTTRVTLISPARSEASEEFRFDDGTPLSPAGLRSVREANAAADALPASAARTAVSPSPRCAQTAEGLLGVAVAAAGGDERLAGCGMGRWRGRTLEEVSAADPDGVARWLSDPAAAPHGGESVEQLCARTGEWLTEVAEVPGRVLAVVEPDVVRALVVHALGAPARTLWRLDVAPLTATELSGRSGRWNLRAGTALPGR